MSFSNTLVQLGVALGRTSGRTEVVGVLLVHRPPPFRDEPFLDFNPFIKKVLDSNINTDREVRETFFSLSVTHKNYERKTFH